jgi:hypothetical protein
VDIPIHVLLSLNRETKIRERERIKKILIKNINNSTILQQVFKEIEDDTNG